MPDKLQRRGAVVRARLATISADRPTRDLPDEWAQEYLAFEALVAEECGPELARWAVMRWLITRVPIRTAIAVEQGPIGVIARNAAEAAERERGLGAAGVAGQHHAGRG